MKTSAHIPTFSGQWTYKPHDLQYKYGLTSFMVNLKCGVDGFPAFTPHVW